MMTPQIRRTRKELYVSADFVRGEEQHREIFCTEGRIFQFCTTAGFNL